MAFAIQDVCAHQFGRYAFGHERNPARWVRAWRTVAAASILRKFGPVVGDGRIVVDKALAGLNVQRGGGDCLGHR